MHDGSRTRTTNNRLCRASRITKATNVRNSEKTTHGARAYETIVRKATRKHELIWDDSE